jgi:hypothetical protein
MADDRRSMSALKIIYNLEGLSDAEIAAYIREVSIYFDLDPGTNWFDVLWLVDSDTGLRRRQLYARRGTTDVLRDKRVISVTDMIQHDGPGYVSFTATGKDRHGRQEIAVGAHSTENLKGEKLAAAVATAETRAGRRLTLKFCGLGILDYSEVSDPVETTSSPVGLTPVGHAPVYTSIPTYSIPVNPAPTTPTPYLPPIGKDAREALAEANAVTQMAMAALELQKALEKPVEKPQEPVQAQPEAQEPPAAPRKPRGPRKNKNTVTLDEPQPIVEAVKPPIVIAPTPATPPQPPTLEPDAYQPTLAPTQPTKAATYPGAPSTDQQEEYRKTFREYANNILPIEGKMTTSVGIGGATAKLRLFFQQQTGKSTEQATVQQWEDFINFLHDFHGRNGAKGLTKYINDSIEAK